MHDITSYATLECRDGTLAVRFERALVHTPADVWHALTDSVALAHWFPADLIGARMLGEPLAIVSWTGQFPPARGYVTALVTERLFEYTWGNERLRWTLAECAGGSVLGFQNWLDDAATALGPDAIAAAWHTSLDALERWLAGSSAAASPAAEELAALTEYYAARFAVGEGAMPETGRGEPGASLVRRALRDHPNAGEAHRTAS